MVPVHGLDLICSELEERNGRVTGRYRHSDCCGPIKAQRIKATLDLNRYDTVYAYGDSREDRQMLALADRKFFRWVEIGTRERVE